MGKKVDWSKLDATCGKTWTDADSSCGTHWCMEKGSHRCKCRTCGTFK